MRFKQYQLSEWETEASDNGTNVQCKHGCIWINFNIIFFQNKYKQLYIIYETRGPKGPVYALLV